MSTVMLTAAQQSFWNLPRRRFSKEEKHRIVREFLQLGIPLARFARERDLHYNQLSRWRKEYLVGEFDPISTLRSPYLQWIPVKVDKPTPQSSTTELVAAERDDEARAARDDMPELGRLRTTSALRWF
jgi:transposase-like protein